MQKLDSKIKEYLRKNYKTPIGKFDIYVPFIERGIEWLKEGSKLGYINPNLFINREYGKLLRRYLLNYTILQIIDFGDSGVFRDVTNYPCILIVQKNKPLKNHRIKTIVIYKPKDRILYDIQKKYYQESYKNKFFHIFWVEQRKLGEEPWKLVPSHVIRLIGDIKRKVGHTLQDISEKIYEGFITGANDVYFVDSAKAEKLGLEKELLKPVPKGKDVKRWRIKWKDRFVIYPYILTNNKTKPISDLEIRFPSICKYFKDNREKLMKRKYLIEEIKKGRRSEWFELWNPRNYNWFIQNKIITPNLSTTNNFAFDEKGYFLDHDCYGIILKDKSRENYLYVLGLLNSRLLEFYIKQISPYASGKYYRYMTGYLEKLPIKIPETKEERKIYEKIINIVEKIMDLYKKIDFDFNEIISSEDTERLCDMPQVSFKIDDNAKFYDITTKNSRIYINEQDYIETSDKNLLEYLLLYFDSNKEEFSNLENVKTHILNIPVPKSKDIIEKIVKEYGKPSYEIEKEVLQMEEELNKLVYRIYGIDNKEIRIIEEFFDEL